MSKNTFYVTTPIYYPSGDPHIGHAYTTVIADALSRFNRLLGKEVFFLTGTDEHGQKIEREAKKAGITPREYTDKIVAKFQSLWELLHISNTDFIRTVEDRHIKVVQEIFKKIYDKGDIYLSEYEGWYCTPCETFFTERQLNDFNCPDCGRLVEKVREESYFFRMSKYQDQLLEYIYKNPEFIQPVTRRNEMINFIKGGLEDLCISRTTFTWGIPVPIKENHVIYVWFDALTNYLTGVGYLQNDEMFNKFWPADVHLVAKDIIRFHTIIWPAILMAAGLPLPKQVFGHGFFTVDGEKMSKSKGNVTDPVELVNKYGVDTYRHVFLREYPVTQDGDFSLKNFIFRANADLANDLGNLLHRTMAMVEKYFGGVVPAPGAGTEFDADLIALAEATPEEFKSLMSKVEIHSALASLWKLIGKANKYIDDAAPWTLAKDPEKKEILGTVMYNLIEILRKATIMLQSYMVFAPEKMWQQLGLSGNVTDAKWDDLLGWGKYPAGTKLGKAEPVFPRIEVEKTETKPVQAVSAKKAKKEKVEKVIEEVSIDDFDKLDLRVAKILSAEKVEGADKLLKLQVELGDEKRQVVSGIAKHYAPDELVGKSVILIANLKPAKIRGIESRGMILAASHGDKLVLATVDSDMKSGSKVN